MRTRVSRCLVFAALLVMCESAAGQSVRVSGSTGIRYIELRPFIQDSIAIDETEGEGLLRQLADGRIVRCIPGDNYCRDVRPGGTVSTIPVLHDVEVSAWGFGRGIRILSQMRARTSIGARSDLWPRGDDAFDVLSLYGEWERERIRVRAGRQWKTSGLGFYNFDGVSVATRPRASFWLEGYTGRSLTRGLNEPRTGAALESVEDLAGANRGVLAGVHARYRSSSRFAASAQYQIDIRGDRSGLYSELALFDGVVRLGGGSLESSVEIDAASRSLNHARMTLRSAPLGQWLFLGEARRYRPYFELWTIWGAFSPVGFDEGRVGATWSSTDGRAIVRGDASVREYGDVDAEEGIDKLRTRGWAVGSSVNWSPVPGWRLDGAYRVEAGFGAARWDVNAGARRDYGTRGHVAVQALVFRRLYEFRLDEGRVVGLGAEAAMALSERARVAISAAVYRHSERRSATMDWSQQRAGLRFEWVLGSEPALASARSGS